MKKVRDIFRKKGFRKGLPRFMNCLSARFSAGRGKDGRSGLFSRLNEMFSTAGAGARGMRPGRSGAFFFCLTASKSFVHATETAFPLAAPRGRRNSARPMTVLRNGRSSFVKSLGRFIGCLSPWFSCFPTASKKFGRAVPLQIGGSHPRAPSPRRWAMPSGMSPQSGRSMIEMLAVLAIIGVLSITALVGFTYAMNKHRANTIYNDVHLLALHVMDTGKDTVPADFYPDSGKTFTLDTTTYADGFVVKVAAVSEKVCDRIIEVNDPSIEKIYVGNEETTSCSGTQDMGFMFLYDGTFTSGGGSSGGSSGSSGSGSGSGTDPVDPCEGIIASTDCSISADETDSNGCVTVKKITCTGDTYCSGTTCEPCPVAETCAGESCCTLTGPNDVCGRPTKEVGTLTTVTHSDLNANGCCETTTEESCSLNPVTPRTCTPTCDGTCQSGVCESTVIASCNEITQHVCTNGTDEWCCNNGQSCGTEKESCGTCQINGKETCAKDGRPLSMGGCPENAEEICKACGLELVLYNTSSSGIASYKCGGQKLCGVNETWQAKGIVFYSDKTETTSTYTCVPNNYVKICYNYGDAMWGFDYYAPGTSSSHGTHEVPCEDLP